MKLAAIILNYNDAEGTVDALKRITGFSCFTDIIVVDNASTDNSTDIITTVIEKAKNNRVHFIINDKNGGYGYGNNVGVRYAHDELGAELAVIANPDAVFDESLIINMQRVFEQDRRTAAVGAVMREHVGCKLYKSRDKSTDALSVCIDTDKHGRRYIDITSASKLSSLWPDSQSMAQEAFTYNEYTASGWMRRSTLQCMLNSGPVSRRLFKSYINYPESYYKGSDKTEAYIGFEDRRASSDGDGSRDKGLTNASVKKGNEIGNAVEVYAVHGSLLMVTTDKFIEAGGYDEEMFLYGEENVLAEKLYQKNYRTYLLKQGYEHAGSVSITGAGLKAVRRQQIRNASEDYYYRHYLDCDESGMNMVRLFQQAVLVETRIAAGLHLI